MNINLIHEKFAEIFDMFPKAYLKNELEEKRNLLLFKHENQSLFYSGLLEDLQLVCTKLSLFDSIEDIKMQVYACQSDFNNPPVFNNYSEKVSYYEAIDKNLLLLEQKLKSYLEMFNSLDDRKIPRKLYNPMSEVLSFDITEKIEELNAKKENLFEELPETKEEFKRVCLDIQMLKYAVPLIRKIADLERDLDKKEYEEQLLLLDVHRSLMERLKMCLPKEV